MSIAPKKLAILVSGGPAPGINSVIGAATIRAEVEGIEVLGIKDGFKWIMEGDTTHVKELNIDNVSRIHFRGGSYIGISRANPTKDDRHLENAVTSLLRLDVDKLITIGGDDTAFSALKVNEMAAGRIKVVHVPKTIDNDLDLPHGIPTFGFQTARHIGVEIVKSLMVDAQTTSRWYFIVTMGRKAGHLALGIGKATGSTITLVPEEFPGDSIGLNHVVDVLVGSIIKRMSYGRSDGVAILAEGIVERLKIEDLDQLVDIERDAHDNIRIAEVNFGEILKIKVQQKLKEYGLKITVVAKNIGYELRCADPIPFDMEYTRDLGFSASQFILDGGSGAMISIQNGRFVPLYFKDILDPITKRTRVRMVDPSSESFYIARKYMLRLNKTDFEDPHELAKLAATAHLSIEEFRKRFYYLIEQDLMYKHLEEGTISFFTADSNVAFKALSASRENGNAID
ncbi:MAG: 6-phosphofructokinase [Ignavibacteriaceae bacterium]|jgi:6-phosphofructokinase 1|nr:6-phosphofructokinase [Ignavibacteriaceae bacterium]